jgi:hypothetical protein
MKQGPLQIPAWALPLIVLAVVVPIVAAFIVGGPGPGLAVGALAAVAIAVVAVRMGPRDAITPPRPSEGRYILLVAAAPVEDSGSIEAIIREVESGDPGARTEVRVLTPARSSFLQRWASDVGPARRQAERDLVVTLANLGKAEIDAEARVGDEDLVQAIEDELRDYPATEVILATGGAEEDAAGERAARELDRRLAVPLRRLVLASGRSAAATRAGSPRPPA